MYTIRLSWFLSTTVPAQIERHCSNFRPGFFAAVVFKFEPNMTVIIKNLAQNVDFLAKCHSNQDCRSICAGMVVGGTAAEKTNSIIETQ